MRTPRMVLVLRAAAVVAATTVGFALATACTSDSIPNLFGPDAAPPFGLDSGPNPSPDAGGGPPPGNDASAGDATVPIDSGGGDDATVGADSGGNDATPGQDATADAGAQDAAPEPTWAQWPMPNSPIDVEAGAPNPESYAATGGVVTDQVTGLMWQQLPTAPDGGPFPKFPIRGDAGPLASDYCAGLTLAGQNDWRLPTEIELASIVDYSVNLPAAGINGTFFPNTPLGTFLSTTPIANTNLSEQWGVLFDPTYGVAIYATTDTSDYVRCVRGGIPLASPTGAPAGRYTASGTGASATVYDTKTKLTWQQTPTADDGGLYPQMTFASAESYCAGTSLNGSPGRLPTKSELFTLMDFSQTGAATPMLDPTFFPNVPIGLTYWSATPVVADPGYSFVVQFDNGGLDERSMRTYARSVRCVR